LSKDDEDDEEEEERRTRQEEEEEEKEEKEEEEEEELTDIKSNNPHLAGGEKRFNLQAPPVYNRKVTNPPFPIIIVSIICFFSKNSVGNYISIDS